MARAVSKTKNKVTKAKKTPSKANNKTTKTGSGSGLKDPTAVCDAVFQFMCEEHSFGVTEWTREELAHQVGFGNPNTEKFSKGIKILMKEKELAENGTGKGTLVLSGKGISMKPSSESKPKTLEDVHNRFREHLKKKVASGANKVPLIWEILVDREPHDIKDIAEKLGYGNPASLKNTKILQTMEKMNLVEKDKNSYKMTDTAFPSGATGESKADDS